MVKVAKLISKIENQKPSMLLEIEFTDVENASEWEGWLKYKLSLENGGELIAETSSSASILQGDVLRLCSFFVEDKNFSFEPTEPDFKILLERSETSNSSDNDPIILTVFIDETNRRSPGEYRGSGLGLRMMTNKEDVVDFSNQLKRECLDLTENLKM